MVIDGKGPEEFAQRILTHLDVCPECQRLVDEIGAAEPPPALAVHIENVATPSQPELSKDPHQRIWLGNYELLEKIGHGGMGAVFKAVHRRMERVVAVKILPPEFVENADRIARFEREVKVAAKLRHQNVVNAYDADVADGVHFLVMEYVDGCNLSVVVKKNGPLPVELAVNYIRQAATGLEFAHRRGIVHRDVKPSNLLLDNEGTVKVLDLGLARIETSTISPEPAELTNTGNIMGTVDYMSPEQALDTKHADARSDVYSLGCSLFYLVTGKPTYSGDTTVKKLVAHREQPIPSLRSLRPDVPEALDAAFAKMLAKNPFDRYGTMTEVVAALDRCYAPAEPVSGEIRSINSLGDSAVTDFLREIVNEKESRAESKKIGPAHSPPRSNLKFIAAAAIPVLLFAVFGLAHLRSLEHALANKQADLSASARKSALLPKTGWQSWPTDAPQPANSPFDTEQAKKHQQEWADYVKVPVNWENSIGMKFVLIPPGEFLMGSPPKEIQLMLVFYEKWEQAEAAPGKPWLEKMRRVAESEGPQHRVAITQPFYLGIHEVTQIQFRQVMDENPSHFSQTGAGKDEVQDLMTDDLPVDSVSWLTAREFCRKLGQLHSEKTAEGAIEKHELTWYSVPTEAQWEYACRAGTTTMYSCGDDVRHLPSVSSDGSTPQAVGKLSANPFGLFDMHGNVYEWCLDIWQPGRYAEREKQGIALDPVGDDLSGLTHIARGGSNRIAYIWKRSGFRMPLEATDFAVGFRVTIGVDDVRLALQASVRHAQSAVSNSTNEVKRGWYGWLANAPQPAIAPFDTEQAKKHQQQWAEHLKVPVERENSIGMKFVLIPPGEFLMGSTDMEIEESVSIVDSQDRSEFVKSEGPRHKVVLTQPFYLGVAEVTQRQFQSVMGRNPSWFSTSGPDAPRAEKMKGLDTRDFPVEAVRWIEAVEFCEKLSQTDSLKPSYHRDGADVTRLDGDGYRLPTDAEWEFACRGGTATKLWNGDRPEDMTNTGWWLANSEGHPQPVGRLQANPFGICDMHGNVSEWVEDWWDQNYFKGFADLGAIDPVCLAAGTRHRVHAGAPSRVFRGGTWNYGFSDCHSATRFAAPPNNSADNIGFRVALPVKFTARAK
jgi:formylglycine-generating enzyme required for sulfatase activity